MVVSNTDRIDHGRVEVEVEVEVEVGVGVEDWTGLDWVGLGWVGNKRCRCLGVTKTALIARLAGVTHLHKGA